MWREMWVKRGNKKKKGRQKNEREKGRINSRSQKTVYPQCDAGCAYHQFKRQTS
jgi:hypothetical protein